ncbi:hypothetical protein P171DRAFT_21166 [Karstenula rhodostoma CBS 690.94]|uniref:Uncharacterized protein n=1 Tax=Karstenula rhodostoma CBS 690.94 TaxID=1392251 RepID=A0A9P4PVK5_9PLEO|nr:hypothetical protein P171DRAFT_21166 [Karstenula rhodostoma CBS 690.94]
MDVGAIWLRSHRAMAGLGPRPWCAFAFPRACACADRARTRPCASRPPIGLRSGLNLLALPLPPRPHARTLHEFARGKSGMGWAGGKWVGYSFFLFPFSFSPPCRACVRACVRACLVGAGRGRKKLPYPTAPPLHSHRTLHYFTTAPGTIVA